MKIILILSISIFKIFASNMMPFKIDVNIIKNELSNAKFKKEYIKYTKNIQLLSILEKQLNKSSKSKKEKYKILDKFISLENRSNSIILTSILLNQSLKIVSLKNLIDVRKYIKPLANKLYEHQICDGYIFKGEYEYSLNNDLEKSLSIYKEGVKNCNLEWKRFEIQSRLNKYTYIYEQQNGSK